MGGEGPDGDAAGTARCGDPHHERLTPEETDRRVLALLRALGGWVSRPAVAGVDASLARLEADGLVEAMRDPALPAADLWRARKGAGGTPAPPAGFLPGEFLP